MFLGGFSARQHICRAHYMLLHIRMSHTGGSVVNGWSEDHAIFTTELPCSSSFCDISLIQQFWRVPPELVHEMGGVEKTSYFLALCIDISKMIDKTKITTNDW